MEFLVHHLLGSQTLYYMRKKISLIDFQSHFKNTSRHSINFYLPSPEIVQYELTEDGQTVRISWNELSYDSENIGETIEPEKYFIMGSFGAYEIISSDDSRFVVDDD